MTLEDYWPFFGLRITTPQLELWCPRDEDFDEMLALISRGVHDPVSMPFVVPWTDGESPGRDRESLQYWWGTRASFSTNQWDLAFVISHRGTIMGVQNLTSRDFPVMRTAESGSWLGLEYQGKGFGKEMRRAVLHFAFESLEAQAVTSGAFADNMASQGVSRAVGYEANGSDFAKRRDGRGDQLRFRMTRERWLATRTDMPIEVTGFDRCRPLFGLD